ncbi:uncharacterized protein LOC130667333 [Microplitis mediator]|uniref:uncharacterized protein LOC130667333 n=1 Tax=Microplitis mediator TaxID=375433 RepID=UPI002553D069|nr:uncharacterized protein LOC130667333 [Microplitis mediator]
MARWLEILFRYDFEIIHRPGKNHQNADTLSRHPCDCEKCQKLNSKISEDCLYIQQINLEIADPINWSKFQNEDKLLKVIIDFKKKNLVPDGQSISHLNSISKVYLLYWDSLELKNDILYKKWESPNLSKIVWQIIVPKSKINDILHEAHNSSSGGHFGINKTLDKIRQRFYWATCKQDVELWCKNCKVCFSKKGPHRKTKAEYQIYNVGSPFERIAIDILGPITKSSSGNRFILVVTDYFTRWPEAIPLPNHRTSTIVEALVCHIICRHALPLEIHSDQAYRSSKHETTEFSPAMLMMGRELRIPLDLLRGSPTDLESLGESETLSDFVSQLKEKMNSIHNITRNKFKTKSNKAKSSFDLKMNMLTFKEKELVWLYFPHRVKGKSPKLQCDWEGPYETENRLNNVVYRIRKILNEKYKIVHVNRLAPYCDQ